MAAGRRFWIDTGRVVWEPNMTNISAENSSLVHMGYVGEMRNLADTLGSGRPISPNIDDGIAALPVAHALLESHGRRLAPTHPTEYRSRPHPSPSQTALRPDTAPAPPQTEAGHG